MIPSLLAPLFAFLPLQAPQAPGNPAAPDHHLVWITVKDARTLDRILALDLDLAACSAIELPAKRVEVIADDADITRIRKAGLSYEIAQRNIEDSIERRLGGYQFPMTLTPAVGKGAMGGHYSFAQVVAILDALTKANPRICSAKKSIGKTLENRDIWMVKISDNVNVDENEPEVLFDAVHHAREPLSATTTLVFMDWLVSNFGKDAEATYLVANREMYFVPMLNPDGYEYNRSIRPSGGGMWRKNRRKIGTRVYGVDLNRNYATGWTAPFGGNSTNPASSTYRGTAAFSEPETLALENFIKSRSFVLGSSTHTYTDILLRPWGYKRAQPLNVSDYTFIDKAATKSNGIAYGAASIKLYIAAGTALDHYHAAHKMFGYTPELGRSNEGRFWPNPANQVAISTRHQPMFRAFAKHAGAAIAIASQTMTEGPGGNSNGKIDPGEIGQIVLSVGNGGAGLPLTNVIATLRSLTPGVTVTKATHDFGKIKKFSTASNSTTPLTFFVASGFKGLVGKLELSLSSEGLTTKRAIDIVFGTIATIVADDFEKDLGWRRSATDTATLGKFERAAPQYTTYLGRVYQPAADHTPGAGRLCWVTQAIAGSSVGSYDVDNGHTSLLSPVIDLRHVAAASLACWVHYAESVAPGDPFRIEVSNDGGASWKLLWSRTTSTNAWVRLDLALGTTGLTMTDKMRFRFWAQDLSASLVEALVDDVEIRGLAPKASSTVLGGGQRGSSARVALTGSAGGVAIPIIARGTTNLAIPGITGNLLVAPASSIALPPLTYGTVTSIGFDIAIPNDATLVGKRFYLQQLLAETGGALSLGNLSSLLIR